MGLAWQRGQGYSEPPRALSILKFLAFCGTFPPYATSCTLHLVNSTSYLLIPVHASLVPDIKYPSMLYSPSATFWHQKRKNVVYRGYWMRSQVRKTEFSPPRRGAKKPHQL